MIESIKRILSRTRTEAVAFHCNICGVPNKSTFSKLKREIPSCTSCLSTVRMRSIVHCLSQALFGRSISIEEFPIRKDIVGIGLSDWDGYSSRLAKKLSYKNTYFHQEPQLDITEIDEKDVGTLDFIISTDVFEHVASPVERAFENAFRLLRTGGALILSVPYTIEGEQTQEHFPVFKNYNLNKLSDGSQILEGTKEDGSVVSFSNLVFHGGAGETLEMRLFSRVSLLKELKKAGFEDVTIMGDPNLNFGIYWSEQWSLPVVAKKK